MLASLNLGDGNNLGTADGRIALDCSVRETRQGHYAISTTDFFFPLVDSPYLQGRIGAANVLSDLYAEGVEHCDFVLMLLAACRDMSLEERNICTQEMVRGFRDACIEADTTITGGQTVLNPWPIIGGVATSVVTKDGFISSDGAQPGDVLVLTKPLGTQVAVNVHEWRNRDDNKFWNKIVETNLITVPEAEDMMYAAVCSMARLNKTAGSLMLKHKANAATDVTGFGILGHAQNLMDNQLARVGAELHTLPVIANTLKVNDEILNFRLKIGYSAETSGGLLISMPEENAKAYIQDLEAAEGYPAWIIGRITDDPNRKATIIDNVKILEV
ncbi:selenide, water dikinase [Nitzschia inconspicua]|uniref:Selenide, water dikinase n=1 Tax=Nitzschia inconspicua TaxID=303405 RepID=A0A9K3K579_9STRA|nr:selenide, water dikinase [Nitzschia inconspicua]KAG7375019.1 selenide, water dikinase [Nitzschia inconspicua]